jgi:hypothetical protein
LQQQLLEDLVTPPSPDAEPNERPRSVPSPAGEDIGSSAAARVVAIGRQMREVESRLRRNDASEPTRQRQDWIARELSRLIEEEKQRAGSSGSRSSQAKAPASQPADASAAKPANEPGMAGADDPSRESRMGDELDQAAQWAQSAWGNLPDRVRQRVQDLGNEEFLPAMADVIREYYRRLAERGSKQP